jgi:hypothetical protein
LLGDLGSGGLGQIQLALFYVLAVWFVTGGITLGIYLAFSLAPLSDLLINAWRASANAMWLVPGGCCWRLVGLWRWGLAAMINSTRLLVLSRAPKGDQTVTALWVGISVSRGALEARIVAKVPYSAAGIFLTLLWTVTLTPLIVRLAGSIPPGPLNLRMGSEVL